MAAYLGVGCAVLTLLLQELCSEFGKVLDFVSRVAVVTLSRTDSLVAGKGPYNVRSLSSPSPLPDCALTRLLTISSTKVKLYASLDKTLADHGAVLEERDKVLAEARASLVADGANVLGGV